jgi:hypothetical protein
MNESVAMLAQFMQIITAMEAIMIKSGLEFIDVDNALNYPEYPHVMYEMQICAKNIIRFMNVYLVAVENGMRPDDIVDVTHAYTHVHFILSDAYYTISDLCGTTCRVNDKEVHGLLQTLAMDQQKFPDYLNRMFKSNELFALEKKMGCDILVNHYVILMKRVTKMVSNIKQKHVSSGAAAKYHMAALVNTCRILRRLRYYMI